MSVTSSKSYSKIISTNTSQANYTTTTTRQQETKKMIGALEILRKEMERDDENLKGKGKEKGKGNGMNGGEKSQETSENIVQKMEKVTINGHEVLVRRVYVLYGSYRVGWVR